MKAHLHFFPPLFSYHFWGWNFVFSLGYANGSSSIQSGLNVIVSRGVPKKFDFLSLSLHFLSSSLLVPPLGYPRVFLLFSSLHPNSLSPCFYHLLAVPPCIHLSTSICFILSSLNCFQPSVFL